METLVRSKTAPNALSNPFLESQIPSPFPIDQLLRTREEPQPSEATTSLTPEIQAGPSNLTKNVLQPAHGVALVS